MAFFSRPFRRNQNTTQTTTVEHPLVIERPTIGFFNLHDQSSETLLLEDRRELTHLFEHSVISPSDIPRCHVLFVYCEIGADGRIGGTSHTLREIFKKAGAYIAVVASENDPDAMGQAIGRKIDWHSNIVLVIDRKNDVCSTFFRHLFEMMNKGQSMLTAWVELSPQIPGLDHPDCPGTLMLAEAGHVTFTHHE